jgi:hypothetical protein
MAPGEGRGLALALSWAFFATLDRLGSSHRHVSYVGIGSGKSLATRSRLWLAMVSRLMKLALR